MPKSLYEEFFAPQEEVVSSSTRRSVPNSVARIQNLPYRLAIVGEAPGADEETEGKPFVGYSGQQLNKFLSKAGLIRDGCYVGNVCQIRPEGNKIANFDWDGPELQSGLATLKEELTAWRPNLVLCLGGSALHAFKAPDIVPRKRSGPDGIKFVFPHAITDWRGSLFEASLTSPCPGVKCLAALHPAACLRNYSWMPLLMMDITKAAREAKTPELILPCRNLEVNLTLNEILDRLNYILSTRPLISIDIEGGIGTMSCMSVAQSAENSFIIPFARMDGLSFWSVDEEVQLWTILVAVLGDPLIPKSPPK